MLCDGLVPEESLVIRSIHKLTQEHNKVGNPSQASNSFRSISRWLVPFHNSLKLNCDAAVGENFSCIAVVARDWKGKLMFACPKRVNTNVPVQAEANAI